MIARVPDVTRLTDRLITAGLVRRERDTADRRRVLTYLTADGTRQTVSLQPTEPWAPLGVAFDRSGHLWVTDVALGTHRVIGYAHDGTIAAGPLGSPGAGPGQLMFPNSAVVDSYGRVYVTDGNNGRIAVWDHQGSFLYSFATGSSDAATSLPRGSSIDKHDRLFVADAVGQRIQVYDVSGDRPVHLYQLGSWGQGRGQFNFPNDVAVSTDGRLYIADRENDRLQGWSY